jgi:hypothetical protein
MYDPGKPVGSYIFFAILGLFPGYLYGWYANMSMDYNLLCILIALLLLVVLKKAKDMHANDIVARSVLAEQHREDDKGNLKLQLDLIKEQAKSQIEYDFTSDNFDRDARGILIGIINKARKQRHKKVTGAILVTEFLKSIH